MFWAKVLEMSNKVLLSFLPPVFNERYLICVPIKDNKINKKIRINKKIIKLLFIILYCFKVLLSFLLPVFNERYLIFVPIKGIRLIHLWMTKHCLNMLTLIRMF